MRHSSSFRSRSVNAIWSAWLFLFDNILSDHEIQTPELRCMVSDMILSTSLLDPGFVPWKLRKGWRTVAQYQLCNKESESEAILLQLTGERTM